VKAVTLADFRPSRRADGQFWTQAKIEGADQSDSDVWELIEEVAIDPIDADVTAEPALRSFTVQTENAWVRLTFLDAERGEDTQPLFSTSQHAFRPTVQEVADILQARTYSGQEVDPDQPMQVLAGGSFQGEFNNKTRPTSERVEGKITTCCTDVARAVGYVPGEKLDDARRVTALKTAAEIERSFIPEQTEGAGGTIFQTLRMTAGEDLASLVSNVWLWTLANRGLQ
jgi:hypothetical protein